MSHQAEMQLATSLVGCKIRDPDGHEWIVRRASVRHNRPAIVGDRYWILPHEAFVLTRADGEVPPIREADPVMREIFSIILARGDVSRDELEGFLDHEDRHPTRLYEEKVAPAVNAVEKLILEQRRH